MYVERNYVMYKKAARILELDEILKKILVFSCCEDTKKMIENISPCCSKSLLENVCSEVDEAAVLCNRFCGPDFIGIKNIKDSFLKADINISMSCAQILNIGLILRCARNLLEFYEKYKEHIKYLSTYLSSLQKVLQLEELIFKSISSQEEVCDDASLELKTIRQKIINWRIKIKDILQDFVKGKASQYLQESLPTIRKGRHVVAVKAENLKYITGIVHDVSASGSTVFVEPDLVLKAQNQLKVLQTKEQNEIAKILKVLTKKCLEYRELIFTNFKNIIKLDFIFAKAKFAISIDAIKPDLVDNGEIFLKKARHPLIPNDVVVPIDVTLGGKFKNLIISGPNTGGKTVALKTIGLLTLMTMCGLLIPVGEGSKVSIFKKVLVAIGDEQSIKDSLSTFSAHMKNIVFILKVVDFRSLVLIDELASGTDPEQGASLAVAITKYISSKKATLAASTHYTQLKAIAFNNKNKFIKNACFEFDIKSLKPTYKLVMGVAGQSYAFYISKKLGLKKDIIDKAKKLMSEKNTYFDEMLTSLENYKKDYKKKFIYIEKEKVKLKELKFKLENSRRDLEKLTNSQILKAKREANSIVDSVRAKANAILDELKNIKNKKNEMDVLSLIRDTKSIVKNSIYGLYTNDSIYEQDANLGKICNEFDIGDSVLIYDIGQKGTIVKKMQKKSKYLVKFGNMNSWVDFNRLKLLDKKKQSKLTVDVKKELTFDKAGLSAEIDLRGYDSQQAILKLDRFIDSCVLKNYERAVIIHGKGSGILKTVLNEHLKTHPNVLTKRFGKFGEGEDGVTILELK